MLGDRLSNIERGTIKKCKTSLDVTKIKSTNQKKKTSVTQGEASAPQGHSSVFRFASHYSGSIFVATGSMYPTRRTTVIAKPCSHCTLGVPYIYICVN